jgi:hypothetical protein
MRLWSVRVGEAGRCAIEAHRVRGKINGGQEHKLGAMANRV